MWKSGRRLATEMLCVVVGWDEGSSMYSYIISRISRGKRRRGEVGRSLSVGLLVVAVLKAI